LKLRIVAVLLLFLCCVNVAAAEYSYWIDPDMEYVYVPVNLSGNNNTTLYIEKSPGYTPNGTNSFLAYHGAASATFLAPEIVSPDDGLIYTVKWYKTSSHNMGWGLSNELSQTTGDKIYFKSTTDYRNWYLSIYNNGASTTQFANEGEDDFADGYHITEMVYTDTSISLFVDGLQYGTPITTNLPDDDMGLYMYIESGTGSQAYSHVRQYTADEPTVTVQDHGTYYQIDIQNNGATNLTDYQIVVNASELNISSSNESLKIQDMAAVAVSLSSPADGSYSPTNNLQFNISGSGDLAATVYIDSLAVWSGSVTSGMNQITPALSEGPHEWYVTASSTVEGDTVYNTSDTWSFTYDSIDPTANTVIISPDADNIAVGTTVNTNIRWSDTNLDYAQFSVNYGSGFVLEDNITFTSSLQWFNTSINTTGYIGETITWKQVAYDDAGNSYIYSDSFAVVLNALNIYVYDEKTGAQILPSNVVVYNEDISQEATVSNITKVASLEYTNLTTGKYIVNVNAADEYYSRRAIMLVDVTSLSELNVYLPSENETVIYNTFKIIDNSMEYSFDEMVVRLDKPLQSGTETIFSSYLDFAGTTATYLIATDQYILYIITPEETINYGWLTPDIDGQIDITLNGITIEPYYDTWYSYNYSVLSWVVNLDYSSTEDISYANFIISNSTAEKYNATALTASGSFNYVIDTNETLNVYFELVREDGATFSDFWMIPGSDAEKTVFPESYPQWLKNSVVTALAILCILGFSSYRVEVGMALGVGIVSVAYLWGEYEINKSTGYTVALLAFIVIIEFVIQQRKEAVR